jgi:hypothetical protein
VLQQLRRRFVPSPEGDSGFPFAVSRHFRAGLWIVSPLVGLDCGGSFAFATKRKCDRPGAPGIRVLPDFLLVPTGAACPGFVSAPLIKKAKAIEFYRISGEEE